MHRRLTYILCWNLVTRPSHRSEGMNNIEQINLFAFCINNARCTVSAIITVAPLSAVDHNCTGFFLLHGCRLKLLFLPPLESFTILKHLCDCCLGDVIFGLSIVEYYKKKDHEDVPWSLLLMKIFIIIRYFWTSIGWNE